MRKQRQYECVGYTVESTSFVEIEFKMRNRIDSVKVEAQKEKDRLKREAEEQAKRIEEEQRMDNDKEISLVC